MSRFRPTYKQLNPVDQLLVDDLKDQAEGLAQLIEKVGGREGALAITKLEEAVMWAVKGITK